MAAAADERNDENDARCQHGGGREAGVAEQGNRDERDGQRGERDHRAARATTAARSRCRTSFRIGRDARVRSRGHPAPNV
jgi:hypothetical protein